MYICTQTPETLIQNLITPINKFKTSNNRGALSSKSSEDLASVDGKAALKAELHRKFSDVLPDGKLTSVYFSDMVVQ